MTKQIVICMDGTWNDPVEHTNVYRLFQISRPAFPVLSAIDATPARSGRAALDALARQICSPLDWATCLQTVVEMQPDAVLEIGPGNALTRLFSELAPGIPARACDDFRTVDGIVAWVQGCG